MMPYTWDHDSISHSSIVYCILIFFIFALPFNKTLGKSMIRRSHKSLARLQFSCVILMSLCDNLSKEMQSWGAFCLTAWGKAMWCCLFSNAFLNSSFSQLHSTRAWWIEQMYPSWTPYLHSGLPRHDEECMHGWPLGCLKGGQAVHELQMSCAQTPRRAILAGAAHIVSKSIAAAAGQLQMAALFLPIFGRHFPCFPDWEVLGGW